MAMLPPRSCDYAAHRGSAHSIAIGYGNYPLGMFLADGGNIALRQLRERVAFSHWANAIEKIIGRVFGWQCPAQIGRLIVQPVAVTVCHLMQDAWRWTMERFADESVNFPRSHLAIQGKIELPVAVGGGLRQHPTGVGARRINSAPHPSSAREFIIGRPMQGSPLFGLVHSQNLAKNQPPRNGIPT